MSALPTILLQPLSLSLYLSLSHACEGFILPTRKLLDPTVLSQSGFGQLIWANWSFLIDCTNRLMDLHAHFLNNLILVATGFNKISWWVYKIIIKLNFTQWFTRWSAKPTRKKYLRLERQWNNIFFMNKGNKRRFYFVSQNYKDPYTCLLNKL